MDEEPFAVTIDGGVLPARAGTQFVRDTLARSSSQGGGRVTREHDLPLEEYHRAGREITNGNPEVYKRLYSRRDDVTLANPFGPPARGWSEVVHRHADPITAPRPPESVLQT
jgi:hypothetical protein